MSGKPKTKRKYQSKINSGGKPNVPPSNATERLQRDNRVIQWHVPGVENAIIMFKPLDENYVTDKLVVGVTFGMLEKEELDLPVDQQKELISARVKSGELHRGINQSFPHFIKSLVKEKQVDLYQEHLVWGQTMYCLSKMDNENRVRVNRVMKNSDKPRNEVAMKEARRLKIELPKNGRDWMTAVITDIFLPSLVKDMETGETLFNPDRWAFLEALTHYTKYSQLTDALYEGKDPDEVKMEMPGITSEQLMMLGKSWVKVDEEEE